MKKKKILILIIIIATGLLGLSSYYLGGWVIDKLESTKLEEDLRRVPRKEINKQNIPDYLVNPPEDKNDSYWKYVSVPFLEVDFTNLIKTNTEIVGWIKIDNTTIDYPIVKGYDNTFYLTHAYDKSTNRAGSIFMDFRNNLEDKNVILYGHRRLDNIMFGGLINLINEDWFLNKDNHIIKISTLEDNRIYQIVSVYTIEKENYYIKTNFQEDTFLEYIDTIKKRSYYDFNTSLDNNDKILTLSTCLNNYGKRLVVHAKLIKKETR